MLWIYPEVNYSKDFGILRILLLAYLFCSVGFVIRRVELSDFNPITTKNFIVLALQMQILNTVGLQIRPNGN